MEKLLLIFICLIANTTICLVKSETIETWGDLCNVRALDQKTAIAKWFVFIIQNRTLTFPTVIKIESNSHSVNLLNGCSFFVISIVILQNGEYETPIAAIQHINFYRKPVTTRIVNGGIGKKFVV